MKDTVTKVLEVDKELSKKFDAWCVANNVRASRIELVKMLEAAIKNKVK